MDSETIFSKEIIWEPGIQDDPAYHGEKITNWLNELVFTSVDYQPNAQVDEWSGDKGVGGLYFSQRCVFCLAPKVWIVVPNKTTDAEKLKFVQDRLEGAHEGAVEIWKSVGICLGMPLLTMLNVMR